MADPTGISRGIGTPVPSHCAAPSSAGPEQSAGARQKLDLQQLRKLPIPPTDHPDFVFPALCANDHDVASWYQAGAASGKGSREAVVAFMNDGLCPGGKEEFQALAIFLVKNKLPNALSWLFAQTGAGTLDLGKCDLGNEEVRMIADWAKTIPFQIGLILPSAGIDADGAALLADALSANTIIHLDLSNNPLGPKGVEALCAGVRHNASLRSLVLNFASVNNRGIEALAVVLDIHPSLAALDLNGNAFDDQGAATLAGALGRNTRLSRLSVLHSRLSDLGLAALASALGSNTTLKSLKISGKDEEYVHLPDALADALAANQTLDTLTVVSRPMSNVATMRLAAAVSVNTALRRLDLLSWFGKSSVENAAVASRISEKVRANALIADAGQALSELSQLPESSVPIPPEVGHQIAAFAAQVAEDKRRSEAMQSMIGAGPLGATGTESDAESGTDHD